ARSVSSTASRCGVFSDSRPSTSWCAQASRSIMSTPTSIVHHTDRSIPASSSSSRDWSPRSKNSGGDRQTMTSGLPSSKRTWAVEVLALSLLHAGCAATPPTSGVPRASTTPLIPVAVFFANRESNYEYRVSPDGGRLAWLASAGGRLTVHFRELQGGDVRTIDTHSTRSLGTFRWAADSRYVLFEQDRDGDQNQHVYLADTERPGERPVDLTPIGAARAAIQRILLVDPDHILVVHNARTRRGFDLVRINVRTGEGAVVAENPGDVVQWITDPHGRLRGRIRTFGDSERIVEWADGDGWRPALRLDLEESFNVVGFTA